MGMQGAKAKESNLKKEAQDFPSSPVVKKLLPM